MSVIENQEADLINRLYKIHTDTMGRILDGKTITGEDILKTNLYPLTALCGQVILKLKNEMQENFKTEVSSSLILELFVGNLCKLLGEAQYAIDNKNKLN